jgi:type IV pilus assembly protein PilB
MPENIMDFAFADTNNLLKNLPLINEGAFVSEISGIHDEPLIQFVDHILEHAIQKSASDIHIEPFAHHCRIRYRQDGVLYEISELATHLASRLITRLKVMANLDISERRLPQDGRFQLQRLNHNIDIRINTCPTLHGEKLVLRILDNQKLSLEIANLGFSKTQQKTFLTHIASSQGMILVTGPTGSGKTVTLYSALRHLNTTAKNISTVEDPIEIQLAGINQVNINPKIGLHFATVLKTFLRQDPDIIMLGEIRDAETASIAIQAAQTGHLVFSTVHTSNALETLTRLQAMGMNTYNLVNSISLLVAQRLIRKLCERCKQPDVLPPHLLNTNSIVYRASGCRHCLHGYLGRTGIYEMLVMTESLAQLLLANTSPTKIAEKCQREGFISLYQSGLEAVRNGVTSFYELHRVLGV